MQKKKKKSNVDFKEIYFSNMSKCAAFLLKRIFEYDPMANDDTIYNYSSCNYTICTFAYLLFVLAVAK